MAASVTQGTAGQIEPQRSPAGAPGARRLAATALDVAVLAGGLLLTTAVGVSVVAAEAIVWLLAAWVLVVAPLYFACYHAFGPGATPGQREARVAVRDAVTGRRIGLGRALARAYGGVLAAVLVVPLVVDTLAAAGPGRGITFHDRLSRTRTVPVTPPGGLPGLARPTAAGMAPLFAPGASGGRHVRRAARLVAARPRLLVGATAGVVAGLLALTALLALLVLADSPGVGADALPAYVEWLGLSALLLASGVYWTQAAIVSAVEAARTGVGASLRAVLATALARTNALSAALLLLLAAGLVVVMLPPLVLAAARFALVPAALVLERRSVLGAFARSWRLTRGRTWRTTGLLMLSAVALTVLAVLTYLVLTLLAAAGIGVLEDVGAVSPLALGFATVATLTLAGVPTVLALTTLGAAWSLLYEDLRVTADARS